MPHPSMSSLDLSSPGQGTNDAGDFVDDSDVETLVTAAAGGDEGAWQKLWAAIEPPLSRIVQQPRFLGRLGQNVDDRGNIVVAVMARLRADQFARLKLYLDARTANPMLKFISWLRVVAKRVGIDYLRAHPDYVRRHDEGASKPGIWIDAGTLPPASQLQGQRPPVTIQGTARELLAYAAGAIPDDQRRAVELWAQDESFDDIAKTLGLKTGRDAERMVRAALERLRRRFRDVSESGQ
jgi:DNA-directed RNA polymerase specialized sigma24 family protein